MKTNLISLVIQAINNYCIYIPENIIKHIIGYTTSKTMHNIMKTEVTANKNINPL